MGYRTSLPLAFVGAILIAPTALALAQEAARVEGGRRELREVRKVGALIGTDVMNGANEKVASIADLVLSPDGSIEYAVLGRVGLAGLGASEIPVPWRALGVKFLDGKWAVDLNVAEEGLDRAPRLGEDGYESLRDPDFAEKVRTFFRPRESPTSPSRAIPSILRASKINGTKLVNAGGEEMGEVEDMLLDHEGRVAYAVVGRGGVLGIGEDYVPVPWAKLRLSRGRDDTSITVVVDASRRRLEQAPLIKGDDYATMLAPGFVEQVDRYFGADGPTPAASRGGETP